MIQFKFNGARPQLFTPPSLGGGVFGAILGIILFILLLPLILIFAVAGMIWIIYMRWKLKKQFQQMADQMGEMMDGQYGQNSGEPTTKRVEVTELPPESTEQ